ncbi:FtsW/RodA/SpoVE family cell cycle protein [Canibacter zhoujuaniae]|uniref:FtsW/RodA/SpoVE family cell cycle protein n=1 Tax=Canibacter zhoujuaniae TaxID=2708343 RepID=UPI001421592E|nr:putative peptidoglycan glycosyltransferase FtsW [Canibacter zhoujuaniae]
MAETGGLENNLRGVVSWVRKPRANSIEYWLWVVVCGLVGFGTLMVASASSITSFEANRSPWGDGFRHLGFAIAGVLLMIAAARIPLRYYERFAPFLFLGAFGVQLLVFTPLGVEVWGNRNWLRIGGFSLQPSEFMKIAMLLMVASFAAIHFKKRLAVGAEIIRYLALAGVAIGPVILGHDLGTASVMGLAFGGALFFGGTRWKTILSFGGILAAFAFFFVITSPNRLRRIMSLSGGGDDYVGLDWQPLHGVWALASGGLVGAGLGNSKAKWQWLPAAENDYIFSIIGEELGLIGTVSVILAYIVLSVLLVRVIRIAPTVFGKSLVGGIMVWIIGQALVNIAVVLRLMPVLGVPLPLISMGGTALISCLSAMGIVIAVLRDANKQNSGDSLSKFEA